MAVLQELISSMTGNIAKAILCVRKYEYGSTITDAEARDMADSLQKSIMNLKSTSTVLGSSYQNVLNTGALGNNYVAMEVQFNPNTLYISTQGKGIVRSIGGDNLGNPAASQIIQMTAPSSYTLQCQLIFDAVNVADAFMTTDVSSSVGSLASTVSSTVRKATSKFGDYSVKAQMDGLMSLLTSKATRQVVFIWGKMSISGELMRVDNTYTMFNKYGNPIRGVSNLTITQVDISDSEREYWEAAYAKGVTASASDSAAASASASAVNAEILGALSV